MPIWQWGLGFIATLQGFRTPELDALFRFFTFLGDEEFYILLFSVVFWCVHAGSGARLAVLFLLSAFTNGVVKDVLRHPRPVDLNPAVQLSSWEGYGLPSGHAQNAAAVWGFVALWARRPWVWIAAGLLTFLIGLSRIYLGVHFPTDVLGGWLLGAGLLAIFSVWSRTIERRLARFSLGAQLLIALALPVGLFLLHPVKGAATEVGALAGLGAGLALGRRYAPFSAAGPLTQRILRFASGLVVVLVIYFGLRVVLPGEGAAFYLPFRFLRYAFVGLWGTLGAPWLFRTLRLAPAPGA